MSYKEGIAARMPSGYFIDGSSCIYRKRNGEVVF
jgi:hypothetical protein